MIAPTHILTPRLALEVVAEAARVLSGASFEGVMKAAPVLMLEALPYASRVELRMKRPEHPRPDTSVASREHRDGPTSLPPGAQILSFDISLWSHPDAGAMILSIRGDDSNRRTADMTAELLTVQVEAALDRAHGHELLHAARTTAHGTDLDIGMALGLLMARQDLSRDAALGRLRELSAETNRTMADIATHVVDEGGVITHRPLLALVPATEGAGRGTSAPKEGVGPA